MGDNGLRVFPRETMDKVAEEFCNYFKRKNGARLSYEDAKKLIDYVSGPAPKPADASGIDYSRPVVSGGGSTRPTKSEIDSMLRKYEPDMQDEEWDKVFDEVLDKYKDDKLAINLIYMLFRDGYSPSEILDKQTEIYWKLLKDKNDGTVYDRDRYYRDAKIVKTWGCIEAYRHGLIEKE